MDLDTIVAIVTEEVRRILAEREASNRRLLVVMTGTPCHEDVIRAQLVRLRDSGRFQPTLLLSHTAAARWDCAGLKEALGCSNILDEENAPTPPELVWQADAVLVPWLTLNTAGKLALGICDNLVTSTLMMALLKGLPVVACAEQADPGSDDLKGWAHPAPALASMLRDRLTKLRCFGMTLVGHDHLAATLLNGGAAPTAPAAAVTTAVVSAPVVSAPVPARTAADDPVQVAAPVRSGSRPLVTEADVRAALEADNLAALPADAIWTPLARELLSHAHRTGR